MKICRLDEVVPDTGVAALVGGEQVAVFRVDKDVYAIGNRDPFSGANVLSRGIVGELKGELVVASPVYKQHFSLRTGRCLEDADERVPVYEARVEDGFVHVEPRKEVATTCAYCGVGCGVLVSTFGNEIHSVRGDPAHPANHGRLCTKGTTLHLAQRPDYRLLYPEVRAARGKPGRRTSWDEALDVAARRFRACIDKHGPDSVAFYISGQLLTEDYYVFNKLAKGLIGTNNVDTNSRLCMSSAVAGYKLSLGADAPPCCYEDIDHAELIFIAGSNTAFAHPVVYRRIEEARAKNPDLKVIVVDPRATLTARSADLHLAIKPGTDVALFNSMLHVMAREGLLDEDYIRDHTEGFAVPEWTPEVCEVPAESIIRAARMFGTAGAVLSLYCQGLNQSVNGTWKNSALINLHLATGQIGRPGAGPFSLTGQPNAMGGREVGGMANLLPAHRDLASQKDRDEVAAFWGVAGVPEKPGKTAVEMFEAIGRGEIKAVWIACTNPAHSMPDAEAVRKALSRADFVVVQEAFRDAETCDYADLLLPASSWAEKEGTVTNSERRISRVRAAVAAPGEARADWRIVVDFARRLGGAKLFPYETPEAIFNEHRETTRGRDLDITELSYAVLEDGPRQWPNGRKRLYEDGVFPTPSGRARFVRAEYVPPAEDVSEGFPLRLTTGRLRDQWHTMSRTGLVAKLFGHSPEPELSLHAEDLARFGIADGDLVRVSSRRGAAVLKARVSDEVRRGDAFMAMHWGSRFTGGAGANALTVPAFDPFSKQPDLKHAAVRVERLPIAWRKTLACPATADAHRAAAALLRRFDYAALSLVGEQLRADLAAAATPDAATLSALAEIFGSEGVDAVQGRAVCACFAVTEAAIREAVEAGATLASLQARLKCGTNCGSCLPELKRLATTPRASAVPA
jgi:assimilatory nitrate reductase catalytic subunit